MTDYGALKTDAEYMQLEKELKKLYTDCAKDIQRKMNVFFAKYSEEDARWQNRLKVHRGKEDYAQIEAEYQKWLKGQVFQGRQWQAKKDSIVNTLYHANEAAVSMMNNRVPNILQINGNYAAYQLENKAGVNFGFNLYDSTTVKDLVKDNIDVLPYKKIDKSKDTKWNYQNIKRELTKGIIQGESIKGITKRLATVVPSSNMSFIRTQARTMYTSAQNEGRLMRYHEADEMGVKVKKQWIATLDDRTRYTHQELDGQVRDLDEPFEVEGYELMYPADPHAEPVLVYNCRCTMNAYIEKYPPQYKNRSDSSGMLIKNMTYGQWKKWKESK